MSPASTTSLITMASTFQQNSKKRFMRLPSETNYSTVLEQSNIATALRIAESGLLFTPEFSRVGRTPAYESLFWVAVTVAAA
jgi:hypothetical protein